tara:strand:- start:838 stop:1242 length:405 start_codon:yes stop_codon:yes gene_type:complete
LKKEIAEKHIVENLAQDDELVGFFEAVQPFKFWLFFVIGPLAVLSMKNYFVAVTKRGVCFYRLNLLGKFAGSDFFKFNDIENVKIGNGILQRPFLFQFKNGRKLKINALVRGVEKISKLNDNVQKYIESNVTVI